MAGPRDIDETDDEEVLDPNAVEGDDAGSIDDEGGDDAQTGQELEADQAQERVDRRSRRDDTLREELRAQREHNARVEAELRELRQIREASQQRPQEESEDQFLARIALLDPESRMDAKVDRALKRSERQSALQNFALIDRADKAAFDARAETSRDRKRLAAQVEQTVQNVRRGGGNVEREVAYKFLLGEERDKMAANPRSSPAREQGQRRVQSQQARTTGGRGDEPREQRQRRYAANDMSADAVRSRLEAPDAYI